MELRHQHQVSGSRGWTGFLAALLLAGIAPVDGGVAGWLNLGRGLVGESKDRYHPDWIEIEGFGIDGARSTATPGSFELLKRTDRSSPGMFLACAQGSTFPTVVLDLDLGTALVDSPVRIELEDVIITSHGTEAQAGRPFERFNLAFGRIVYTYRQGSRAVVSATYDQGTGSGSTRITSGPDSDGDGMLDAWEVQYGLAVGVDDSAADPDGDGMTHLEESRLGTNPKSGASFFRAVLQPAAGQPTLWELRWNSVAGQTYEVEWSPDLKTPFRFAYRITPTGTTGSCTIPKAGVAGFYRVRLP